MNHVVVGHVSLPYLAFDGAERLIVIPVGQQGLPRVHAFRNAVVHLVSDKEPTDLVSNINIITNNDEYQQGQQRKDSAHATDKSEYINRGSFCVP